MSTDHISLSEYVDSLNKKAAQMDMRSYDFVPPRGTVLLVNCHEGKIVLGIASGSGSAIPYIMPEDISFKCTPLSKGGGISLWNRFKTFLK